MNSETLKPCPFCGGEAVDDCGFNYTETLRYVMCRKCEAQGPVMFSNYEAVKAWNERYYSWSILMEILDTHYPADIFCGQKDTGTEIVVKIREINLLRKKAKEAGNV